MSLVLETAGPESLLALPAITPPFARTIGSLATEVAFSSAVTETFNRAGISFRLEGELPANQGLIIASDHRQRLEPLLVQSAVDPCGRNGSHVLAMPTSFAGRMMQSSGRKGMDLITPIVPCGLSNQNGKPSLRHPRAWYVRTRYSNVFGRSPAELRSINNEALTTAAQLASDGQAVTICPGGKVAEAAHVPWQAGLGRIVRRLSPEAQETTQIAVFRPDTFSVKGVMKALLLQDFGMRRPRNRQTIVLRAASLGTANELFGSLLKSDDPLAAQQISDTVRRHYIDQFSDYI